MTSPNTTSTTPDVPSERASSPAEQLIRQLYGLGAVRRELSKAAQHELATPGFPALGAIYHRGACRVSAVAADLQVDLSVASRQIAGLVTAGLVERRPDPADGRAHLLHLTAAGTSAIHRAHDHMVAVLGDTLGAWTPADIETLAHGLERLTQSFNTLPSADQEVSA